MELIKKTERRLSKTGKSSQSYGMFRCPYCNLIVERQIANGQKAQSCGCMFIQLQSESHIKHGMEKTRLYRIWRGMKKRCSQKSHDSFKYYGARGISICKEWENDFITFKEWAMGNGYEKSLTIDRKKVNGDYCPKNCRFISLVDNSRWTRNTRLNWDIVHDIRSKYASEKVTQIKLAKEYGVCNAHISNIINNKTWSEL